jgi:hypothetical protein
LWQPFSWKRPPEDQSFSREESFMVGVNHDLLTSFGSNPCAVSSFLWSDG